MLSQLLLLCEAEVAVVTFFSCSEAWYWSFVIRSIVSSVLCGGIGGGFVEGNELGRSKWKPIFELKRPTLLQERGGF